MPERGTLLIHMRGCDRVYVGKGRRIFDSALETSELTPQAHACPVRILGLR